MDFRIPQDVKDLLVRMDAFIESENDTQKCWVLELHRDGLDDY